MGGDPFVFLETGRLFLQPLQAGTDLREDVADPLQVPLRLLQAACRFLPTRPVDGDARRFFEEGPPFLGAEREGGVHQPLTDDGVGPLGEAAFGQQLRQVPQTDAAAVEEVFALAGAVGAAADGHLGEVDGEPAVAVIQRQQHLCHPRPRPSSAAGEDHIRRGLAPQHPQALLPKRPADGIGDVGLAGAVRPHDGGDAGGEDELGPTGEGFVPLEFKPLEPHTRGEYTPL